MLKMLLSSLSLLSLVTFSGVASSASAIDQFQYYSGVRYQIKAVDVFRLNKKFPQQNIRKQLRPLLNTVYSSEQALKTALKTRLNEPFVDANFDSISANAKLKEKKLVVKVYSDTLLQLSYLDVNQSSEPGLAEFINLESLKGTASADVTSNAFSTGSLKGKMELNTLCVELSNTTGQRLTLICPDNKNGLEVVANNDYRLSGLGQEFSEPGVIDGSWNGKIRHSGNKMEGFNGGATGNTQFPVLYASHPKKKDFAIYLDNLYASSWDFSQSPWEIKPASGQANILFYTGDTLSDLRSTYMKMVGNPLVPPRKMFGLWLSEYGFDNWKELDDKLQTLKQHDFTIDGVVMDLQWFGNVSDRDAMSQMGSLTWDEENFPNPQAKIAKLKKQGVGMMLIEESYISEGLDSHKVMDELGYLAKDPQTGRAIDTDPNGIGHWWGKGGMIDWSNASAGKKWHEWKRAPLVDMGIIGHWTDLGEPEMYNGKARYFGDKSHQEVHNLYNYQWLESIFQGYKDHATKIRPFMMSRSGAPGVQKFGTSMWSADIGSNLTSLAVHIGMQENMMLSGIDYYGSDIGGFHRSGLRVRREDKQQVLDETYTQWFAYSALFDVPVRPHTENLCNCKETAPDRVGDMASNHFNLKLRYQLIPYLYSLAHTAANTGEPVFPTLSYNYPNDAEAVLPDHKMMGKDILSVAVAQLEQKTTDVYLPAGTWYDFHTNQELSSENGLKLDAVPLYRNIDDTQVYTLPLYVRKGAIIPTNGFAADKVSSEVPDTLLVKLYGLPTASEFTLFEDDGETIAYQNGEVRATKLTAKASEGKASLRIASSGDYQGAKHMRTLEVQWVMADKNIEAVLLNGKPISDWRYENNQLMVSIDSLDVTQQNKIEVIY